jgi:hypothetical protein
VTDPPSPSRPVPPASTPAAPRKRLPGPRAVRWRYKLARWTSVVVGGFAAVVVIEAALANLAARKLSPDLGLDALALLLLVVGLGVPWLLVEVLWRRKRRRHGWGP